jgi:hypothetical protein
VAFAAMLLPSAGEPTAAGAAGWPVVSRVMV